MRSKITFKLEKEKKLTWTHVSKYKSVLLNEVLGVLSVPVCLHILQLSVPGSSAGLSINLLPEKKPNLVIEKTTPSLRKHGRAPNKKKDDFCSYVVFPFHAKVLSVTPNRTEEDWRM